MIRNVLIAVMVFGLFAVASAKGNEIQVEERQENIVSTPSNAESQKGSEDSVDKEMSEHKQKEEGMHEMMMGPHMGGWWIVIGAVMVS